VRYLNTRTRPTAISYCYLCEIFRKPFGKAPNRDGPPSTGGPREPCSYHPPISLFDRWFAAEEKAAGPSEVIFLIQILALILVGRVLGELMQRMGRPGQPANDAGILLGHSVFGVLERSALMFPSGHKKAMLMHFASYPDVASTHGMETDRAW
jgi:hypothetical protein